MPLLGRHRHLTEYLASQPPAGGSRGETCCLPGSLGTYVNGLAALLDEQHLCDELVTVEPEFFDGCQDEVC